MCKTLARPYGGLRWVVGLCLAGFLTAALALAGGPPPPRHVTIEGRVVRVHDGDTITLSDAADQAHQIRLNGIDAPEVGQAFGKASKRYLSERLADRRVVAECHKTDRYGREVCLVFAGGSDVGLEQIQAGMAWYFRRYGNELPQERRKEYADVEAKARAERRGLWADKQPIPPWDWRRDNGR